MIDINKTYRTRCGHPVRIYATDGKGMYPVHGLIDFGECHFLACWTKLGEHQQSTQYDIIEVKPRIQREVWVNLYRNQANGGCYPDKATADRYAESHRLACLMFPVDCEEGEGL